MLRIARLTDATGRYYLEDLATEVAAVELATGRVSRTPDRPGRWLGAGARPLGVTGPADPAAVRAVLSGCHPATGWPLRVHPTRVCAYDLTFSAPKSVSVLFGLAGAETVSTVLLAHIAAVEAAMGYVESHGVAVRRGSGDERRLEATPGLLAVAFTHGVSRALDPHLHTHVVVPNLAHGVDGHWTAIDGRGLYAHARAAGALYDAHLRRSLGDELTVSWSRRRSGAYEMTSVDPMVMGALSGRRAEIRAHLHEHAGAGLSSAAWSRPSRKATEVAWAATREPKAEDPTPAALRRLWAERAASVGVGAPELVPAHDIAARTPPGAAWHGRGAVRCERRARELDEYRFAASLGGTPRATLSRRDVVAAWAAALEAGAAAATVDRCVDLVARWGDGIGVAEGRLPVGKVVVPPHLLRALGARPTEPARLSIWQSAASAVEQYRSHWMLEDSRRPLGVDASTNALSKMPAHRLAEHLAVSREIADANRLLGRELGRGSRAPVRALARQ